MLIKKQKSKIRELKLTPINQWAALNNVLRVYKIIGLSLAGLSALLVVALMLVSFRAPLVVVKEAGVQTRLLGNFKDIEINEKTIEKVVKRFIHFRYQWRELNPQQISKTLLPVTTRGANRKITKMVKDLKDKNFKGKKVSQTVTDIKVQVSKDKILASFDKILKIEGLPLPIPTLIHLDIVEDSVTHWNPEGLYVNGVIERQVH